jgi:hypothetical protein
MEQSSLIVIDFYFCANGTIVIVCYRAALVWSLNSHFVALFFLETIKVEGSVCAENRATTRKSMGKMAILTTLFHYLVLSEKID